MAGSQRTVGGRSTDAHLTTNSYKVNTDLGRYTNVPARGPLVIWIESFPGGWRTAIERAVILLVIVGLVVGLLILANRHDVNVYSNIVGGNGE